MELFFRLFNPDIPWLVMASISAILVVASIGIWHRAKENRFRKIIYIFTACYVFIILYLTIFERKPGDDYMINLVPFWSYEAIRDGLIEVLYEKLYNIILFIPYGFLLKYSFVKHRFKKVIATGIGTSMLVEIMQLITKTGMCETDDVIHNSTGLMVGYVVALLVSKTVTHFSRYHF